MHVKIIKYFTLHVIAILLTIFNLNDIKTAAFPGFMPLFDVMMIFYFAVYRNGVFGFLFLFLLGIWNDALTGLPIGITAFCYLVLVKLFCVLNQKLMMKENFKQVLQQFIAFISCILFFKWILISIYNATFYNINAAFIQLVLSSILYIAAHRFFDYLSYKLTPIKYGA